MGTRTVRIIGKGYAPSGDVSVVATMSGNEVHNGPVTTSTADPETDTITDNDVLFSFDIDDTVSNATIPVTVAVSGGQCTVVTYAADKLNPADFTEFVSNWKTDVKTNIVINGVAVNKDDDGNTGTWHVPVMDGETATMDWHLRQLPWGVPGNPRPPGSPSGPELGPNTL